jgi:hypothetical protein
MIGQSCRYSGRRLDGSVNPAEVVIGEEQGQGRFMVFPLLQGRQEGKERRLAEGEGYDPNVASLGRKFKR